MYILVNERSLVNLSNATEIIMTRDISTLSFGIVVKHKNHSNLICSETDENLVKTIFEKLLNKIEDEVSIIYFDEIFDEAISDLDIATPDL